MPSTFFGIALLVCTVSVGYGTNMPMPGAPMPQDPNDPWYMQLAWKAAKEVSDDASNAGPYDMIPIKVLSAKSQVVAGALYNFHVLFGESTCKKGDTSAAELSAANCKLKDHGERTIYEVTLWEKPWENFEQFNVKKVRTLAAGEQV